VPLRAVLSTICDARDTRIELPAELESSRYDIHLVLPHDVNRTEIEAADARGDRAALRRERHIRAAIETGLRADRTERLISAKGRCGFLASAASHPAFCLVEGPRATSPIPWTSTVASPAELVQVLDLHLVESDPPAHAQKMRSGARASELFTVQDRQVAWRRSSRASRRA